MLSLTRKRFAAKVRSYGGSVLSAEALGCSRSYVDMIIKGDRRPGIRVAYAIERVFGIAMQDWVEDPFPRAASAPTYG